MSYDFMNPQSTADGWQANLPPHEREGFDNKKIPNPHFADMYTRTNPGGNAYALSTNDSDLFHTSSVEGVGETGFETTRVASPTENPISDPPVLQNLDDPDDYFAPITDLAAKPDSPQSISETVSQESRIPDEKSVSVNQRIPRTRARRNSSKTAQSDAPSVDTPTPRRKQARHEQILAIDGERSVQTREDKLRDDMLDIVESQKSRKILTGIIQGVERSNDSSFAVIYHGEVKVIIPAEEVVTKPDDLRGRSYSEVMNYLLTKRLGAEIDFVIKGLDVNSGIAAASRLDAMTLKRRQYYFGSDRDGNNLIYEGLTAEARVVPVIRAGIFVDLFGLETYIPLRELSYQRWSDAGAYFEPGQRVLVKILKLNLTDRENIKVSASVKQAAENPYEQALKRYTPDSRYVGTVSMVDTNGVFVSLEGGVDCLCTYPQRGRPVRGSKVTVRIIGINYDSKRIWGAITHMTSPR